MSFDKLQEPHKSVAKQLSRTKLVGAISSGDGAAVAFVSDWDDYMSIDGVVVNPSYMGKGENAEVAVIEHVVKLAREAGTTDVRLRPSYQVDGAAFYERCGFFPAEELEAPPEDANERTQFDYWEK